MRPIPKALTIVSRVLILGVAILLPVAAIAQEHGWKDLLIDEQDGHLDMSNLLARGGFIPMPIIITEPAVDGGFGLSAYFVGNPEPGSGLPPTRTIAGGAVTGNGSSGGGFMRSGALGGGKFLYSFAAGAGLSVMDFYPGNRDFALTYNNDIRFVALRARYKFGDSGFSAGPSFRYRSNDVRADAGDRFPGIEDVLGREIVLPSLGLEAHFDNRDNPITPTDGFNVVAEAQSYDGAWGSDRDFSSASLFGAWFGTQADWTLGIMGNAAVTSGDAPFFMEPDINIRGLARNRYRGERALSTELEIRKQVTPRWAVLGFAGYGETFGGGDSDSDAKTYGGGVRYRIARKIGLDVGLDYARGPEQDVFYIQFGHAWGRQMD
ncbi:hypothetical protein [Qingshengfaniella alkalisoli]|uniref:Bacterial surface antigen (D15) domain-containing protein n=1 Tax=Qingshengfaniella alkalisoli TaxID=2599296 RepID=A0A5B8IT27_9RHOB|nr:hypothetical protein [Qingshengfaniella alkalisoli]QDY68603.1 hypothetical protein FPZ52_02530 [Qingshengfaniella alkalisoli]